MKIQLFVDIDKYGYLANIGHRLVTPVNGSSGENMFQLMDGYKRYMIEADIPHRADPYPVPIESVIEVPKANQVS